jgi:TM2 domain-containing membrane protein YozV
MNQYDWQRFPELAMMSDMSQQQRVIFMAQYQAVRKDEVVGVLLAVLLGHFGAHRFYMGEIGLGLLYLAFCWTGIPTILGFIECFFMPGRVREYNVAQAMMLAAHVKTMPGWASIPLVPVGAI